MLSNILRVSRRIRALAHGDSATAAVFVTISVRVALLVLNFGTGIIVARSLGPSGRGELAAIAMWPTFIAALATLGIPTALRYHMRRQPENEAQYYAASVLMMLLLGVVAGGVGVIIMPLALHGYDANTVRTAQAFMVLAPQTLLGFIVTAKLEAVGEFRRAALIQLNQNAFTLIALLTLYLCGRMSPLAAALSYAVPSAIQTLWLSIRLWPRSVQRICDVVDQGGVLLSYGLPSYGTDIIGTLANQLDLAVIILFLSSTQLGLYSIALTLSRLLNIVQTSIVTVIFPRASSLEGNARLMLISRAARLSTLASIGFGVVFLIFIPIVLPRVYGHEYIAAIPLMPLLTAEAIIGGFGTVLKQSFLASGRPFVVTLIEGGAIVCALGLLFILVPRMNILGAATALLGASVVRVVAIALAYRIVLKRPMPQFWPDMSDLAYIREKIGVSARGATRLAKES